MNQFNTPKQINRKVQIGEWIFEVKMVRAIKVAKYGDPYSAIANINFYDDIANIDGVLLKEQTSLSEHDHKTFKQFCTAMAVNKVNINEDGLIFPASVTHVKHVKHA